MQSWNAKLGHPKTTTISITTGPSVYLVTRQIYEKICNYQ